MPLTLDDLDFSQFTFELRFQQTYLLWDRAGKIWQETVRFFPNVTVPSAVPTKIIMRDGPFELTVEPNRLGVQLFEQKSLEGAPAITADFTHMVTSVLELSEYTRLGLRMIYWKTFPTSEAAAAAVMNFGLLKIPEGRHFGAAGPPLNPEIAFRKEDGSKGFSVRIKAEAIEYKMDLPYIWNKIAKSVSEVHQILSFDIDTYLQGTILSSQIAFEDWISQSLHVIRRDADVFLGGV